MEPDAALAIAQTFADLEQDFGELLFLAKTGAERLEAAKRLLASHPEYAEESARELIASIDEILMLAYPPIMEELDAALEDRPTWKPEDASSLIALKQTCANRIRSLQGLNAAARAALDWQSPSYAHAFVSQAGSQTGRIRGTINDYKRDHHMDAEAYEHAFAKEYVDKRVPFPIHTYVTSSGMAAFATIVNALQMRGNGPILVGRSSYFENKIVLQKLFRDRIVEVDEMDADGIIRAVEARQPYAIFLDSLCNTDTLATPDLATLLPKIASAVKRDTYLVLDNSCLATSIQPLRDLPVFSGKLKLIVMESLNKHHQFGMDRVTGGVIWTQGFDSHGLFGARMHLGTNMPDASVLSLPAPNRTILDARLARTGRNTLTLARALDGHIRSRKLSPISHIVYPGLETHPGYGWTQNRPFNGSCFVIAFHPAFQRVFLYQMFIKNALAEAKRAGLHLTAGTSFGLNTTRVYLTALHAHDAAKPFLRVAVGTETAAEIDALAGVFTRTIDKFSPI